MEREVFSESEKRFLLTQILQASSIPAERILTLFNECNDEPRWENIYLPKGRTLQECKAAFEAIRTNTSPFATPNSPGFNRAYFNKRKAGIGSLESSSSLSLESKRRLSGINRSQDMVGQIILPKLSPTESITSSSEGMFSQYPILPRPASMDSGHSILEVRGGQQHFLPKPASMDSITSALEIRGSHQHILPRPSPVIDPGPSVPEIVVKKRGRPPKAEVERRQQALARGEFNSSQSMMSQIMYQVPEEKSGIASSSSISSQVSTSSPKSGHVVKKSGPLRQPGEGRFSLNNYIKPADRQSPSKTKKKTPAVTTSAGPESSTPRIPIKATSQVTPSPKTPDSNTLFTEAQNLEKSLRKLDEEPSEESQD